MSEADNIIGRRELLWGAASVTLATARAQGASDRLRVGLIGAGSQGLSNLRAVQRLKETENVEVTAVCDVYAKRREAGAKAVNGKEYKDYRELLADKDIDYVIIATPEHWHYQMIVDAVQAGKHVYAEKPMTHTIEEAKKIVALMKNAKVKLQIGVQGMSDDSYESATKYVKDGTLGKVVLAQIDYSRNYVEDFWKNSEDPDVRPGENLDWKAWLGPAPKRNFEPERFFSWRRFFDYSGGIATDLFVHRATRLIKALDLQCPEYVVATGGKFFFTEGKAEIPDTFNVLLDYPGGPTMQLISSMANDFKVNHVIRGKKATLEFTPEGFTITPQRLRGQPAGEVITHTKTGAESLEWHHRNLINAIRKGEALKCDAKLGYYGVVACNMAVESYRRRKYLKWDVARERVTLA
jgi:predicted dehydrogenase